jgi:steroid 5-alpha reductase family enzyme
VSLTAILLINLAAALLLMVAVWVASLMARDASIVDVFWGLGFVLIAWLSVMLSPDPTPRAWLMTALTSVWGLRLAGYLGWRKFGKPEDHRYAALRERIGAQYWIVSLVIVFALQACLIWIVSWPLQASATSSRELGAVDVASVVLWVVGFLFESVGDYQLARFKAEAANRGKVFDGGLWRYTRHPNYFGDFLMWWGLFAIAWAGGAPWWTLVSPLVMSYLLLRVSGVSLLESSLKIRTEGYEEYIRRTSAFFPWPPQRG